MRRIKDWPAEERPREKLLTRGAEMLSDAELLALILRTGDAASGTSAVDQARGLLKKAGGLSQLARSSVSELCQVKGVGPAKAAELLAVFELTHRVPQQALAIGDRFTCATEVFHHFRDRFRTLRKEIFLVLLLDAKNKLLREVQVSEGTLTASLVHPREVFGPVVRESAASILLVHNHPSGDPTPSPEDIALTRKLVEAGEMMGVRVLDHVIVGHQAFVSLAEEGAF